MTVQQSHSTDAPTPAQRETSPYLTEIEVVERYRRAVSIGTLRNWRTQRIGPAYVKIGKAVLYPLTALNDWDQKRLINRTAT